MLFSFLLSIGSRSALLEKKPVLKIVKSEIRQSFIRKDSNLFNYIALVFKVLKNQIKIVVIMKK